jgi:hypothetical protein
MADQPAPGYDEIIVAGPGNCTLCSSRGHARLRVLAEVVVTFGELGTKWQPGVLWQEAWGHSFAMCGECWDTTRQIAQNVRPGLVIIQATSPPPQFQVPVTSPRSRV